MKKYYEVKFDQASFYAYGDSSKSDAIRLHTKEGEVPDELRTVYFEQLFGALYKEFVTGKRFVLVDADKIVGNGQRPDVRFNPGHIQFKGTVIKPVSVSEVHEGLSLICETGSMNRYVALIAKMFDEGIDCYKDIKSNSVPLREGSFKKDEESSKVGDTYGANPLGKLRMFELKKQSEIFNKKNK